MITSGWLRRADSKHEATLSPRKMADRYALIFTNPDGTPNGNAEWILNPDLSAVAGFPTQYWIITGDIVTLMSQTEMDVIDADIVAAADLADKISEKARMDVEKVLIAFATVVKDEINILRAQHSLAGRTLAQLKTAIKNEIDNQ